MEYIQLVFNGTVKSITFDYGATPPNGFLDASHQHEGCFAFDDFVFGIGNFIVGN